MCVGKTYLWRNVLRGGMIWIYLSGAQKSKATDVLTPRNSFLSSFVGLRVLRPACIYLYLKKIFFVLE